MCGINGFNYQDTQLIQKMNLALKHRGPDDEGVFVADGLSLGHVRLSILDLSSRGHQPMANENQTLWITYNGEIYNFIQIRNDLISRGYKFKTNTDTEVILYAYQEYGIRAFENFNGIFAFCLYDKIQNNLYLVRDRLGIKPLYYYFDGEKFIFSSEIKPIQECSRLTLSIDQEAINEYLYSNNICSEGFFKQIKSLHPGQCLQFNLTSKTLSVHSFSNIIHLIDSVKYSNFVMKKESQLVDELDKLLNEVVFDQIISDAPLGTICSGGLDSSLISAIAKKYKKNLILLNVQVASKNFDESDYAQIVADHLRLQLISARLDRQKFLDLYQHCIQIKNLPLVHPNSVGIYLVSLLARQQGLSVLLSGEGADELFGGYHGYKAFKKKLLINQISFLKRIFEKIHPLWRNEELMGCDGQDELHARRNINNKPWLNKRIELMRDFYNAYKFIPQQHERNIKAFMAKDLKYYLSAILLRTDRMSMATGIEMRVPYLDNRLIDFALNLPVHHQISFDELKILLKKVAERYLPNEIVHRSKKGFPLPIQDWVGQNHRQVFLDSWQESSNVGVAAAPIAAKKKGSPLRILHIINSLNMGGLEKFAIDLSASLRDLGHFCVLACLMTGGELAAFADKKNLKVVTLNKKDGLDISAVFKLRQLIIDEKINIVHTHNPGPLIYGSLAAKLAGQENLVTTRHGRERKIVHPLIWALNKEVVTISHDARDELLKCNRINPMKVRVIHNGIDLDHFGLKLSDDEKNDVRKSLGLRPDSFVLGTVGRLAEEKDQAMLIKAFSRIIRKEIDAELVIVGDGYLRKQLQQLAQDLGVSDSIKFLGFRSDVERIINIFDVFVLSSNTEGISLTLLEAMAAGKPIIATNVGGNPEVVSNDETGLLVPSADPNAMEDAMLRFYNDPDLKVRMGDASRNRVEKFFGLPGMVRTYEKIYYSLVNHG